MALLSFAPEVALVPQRELASLVGLARSRGHVVFTLPSGIADRAGLFAALAAAFDLDPSVAAAGSWDVVADELFEAVCAHDQTVVLAWPDAARLRAASPEDFEMAIDMFETVVEQLARELSVLVAVA